ncbi:MAG: TRAP transporter substrate-binding protein, partial [Oscillospiraceae bacterium]
SGSSETAFPVSDYDWPEINIQIGHTNSSIATDYKQKLGTLFGDYISQKTNGAITVTVLGDSQLGKENALTEGLQLGMIDMAILSSPTFSNFDNMHLFTELPFLFSNVQAGRAFLSTKEYAEMNDSIVESLGIRFLTTGELGMRYVINNVRPINTVADMAGLKLRTPETDIVLGIFKGLGANPTALAISETLTAIQQDTIDGGEFPTGTISSSGFYEVTKYLSKTNHQYTLCYLAIAESFYEGLAPEVQRLFDEAASYAQSEQFKFIDQIDAEQIQSFVEADMQINEIADVQEFKDAVSDVYTTYRDVIGADFYDRAMTAVDACNAANP